MNKLFVIAVLIALPGLLLAQAPKKAAPAPAPAPAAAPAPAPVAETPAPAPAPEAAPATGPTSNNAALLESAEAQTDAANTEAGKYERKSVTYVNALWLMDASVRGMPAEYVTYTLDKVKEKIMMKRFDYNPLPDAVTADFVAKANAQTEITIDNLAALMDETLVPKILAIVDLNKELRAQNYTSEADRNSFYAIKAKEYGYSDVELAKIMNAAFIFIPVCKSYAGVLSGSGKEEKYTMKMDVGILWYRISTKGEKAVAKLVVKKMTSSMGFAKTKNALGAAKTYSYEGQPVDAAAFAYRSCVKNAARNLLVATQEMPEFRLSGQAVEVDGGKVGFDLGKNEGLCLDDKYRIAEFEEMADGSVKSTYNGWVITTMVADSNSKEGYKSKAMIVAGDPMTGSVLSEFPRIPIDIALKFRMYPALTDESGDVEIAGSGVGLQLDARYNIGRFLKVPQLFAGLGFGFGSASTDSSIFDGASYGNFDILVMKRFLMKRLSLGVEAGLASQSATVTGKSLGSFAGINLSIDREYSGLGFFAGANVGFAIVPALNAEASIRFESASQEDAFTNKAAQSGLGIHIGVIYSPPSLPFDPVDFVRGKYGI